MMCRSASSRAFVSVSAMMTSRVSGQSLIGAVRPAARRLSRNRRLPSRRRLRSAVGPGIQLSPSVAARLSVSSPQPPIQTGGGGGCPGVAPPPPPPPVEKAPEASPPPLPSPPPYPKSSPHPPPPPPLLDPLAA